MKYRQFFVPFFLAALVFCEVSVAQSPWELLTPLVGGPSQLDAKNGTAALATTGNTYVYASDGALRYTLPGQRGIGIASDGNVIDCIKADGNEDNKTFVITKRSSNGAAIWTKNVDFPSAGRVVSGSRCSRVLPLTDGGFVVPLELKVYYKDCCDIEYQTVKLTATGSVAAASAPGSFWNSSFFWAGYALQDGGFVGGGSVFNADLSLRFTANLPPGFSLISGQRWTSAPFSDSSVLMGILTVLPTGVIAPHVQRVSASGTTLWASALGTQVPPNTFLPYLAEMAVNPLSSQSSQVMGTQNGFTLIQRDELGSMLRESNGKGFRPGGVTRTGPFRFMTPASSVYDLPSGVLESNGAILEFFESDGTVVQRSSPPNETVLAIAADQNRLFAATPTKLYRRTMSERTKLRLVAPADQLEVDPGAAILARIESDIAAPNDPIEITLGSNTCTTSVGVGECVVSAPNSIGPAPIKARYAGTDAREAALTLPAALKVRGTSDLEVKIIGLPKFYPVAALIGQQFNGPSRFFVQVSERSGKEVQTQLRIVPPRWSVFDGPETSSCPPQVLCQQLQRIGPASLSQGALLFALRVPANSTVTFAVDGIVPTYEIGSTNVVQTTQAALILDSAHTDPDLTNNSAQVVSVLGIFANGFD